MYPHFKEEVPHVAARPVIDGFQGSNSWIDHFKNRHNLVYKNKLGQSATVNPETVIERKSDNCPK
jgi:hypothetical protein